mgnify:CR=1 FL=1
MWEKNENKNKSTEERKKEVEFIDWALTKVSQGELSLRTRQKLGWKSRHQR